MHGSDTAGAKFHALAVTIYINGGFLNVSRKLPFGFVLRMADVITKARSLTTFLTLSHFCFLIFNKNKMLVKQSTGHS